MAAIVGAASNSDTGNACKRLQKELMALMMNSDDGISAFPDSDNMLNWCDTRTKSNSVPMTYISDPIRSAIEMHIEIILTMAHCATRVFYTTCAPCFVTAVLFARLLFCFPCCCSCRWLLFMLLLFVPLHPLQDGNHHRHTRHTVWWPLVLSHPFVPSKLPVLAPYNQVHHTVLSPKRGCARQHLSWHLTGQVVCGLWCTCHSHVSSLPPRRAQQRQPSQRPCCLSLGQGMKVCG